MTNKYKAWQSIDRAIDSAVNSIIKPTIAVAILMLYVWAFN